MQWTTDELRYMEENAADGADAVAAALGRSVDSVKAQARRYGVSLRPRWLCPRCGSATFHPLSPSTGWCAPCTKEERAKRLEEELAAMRDEAERDRRASREKQRVYSKMWRERKKRK